MRTLTAIEYWLRRWLLRQRHLDASVPALDAVFRVRATDVAGRHLFKYASYESEWTAFLQAWLADRPDRDQPRAVLDVGANLGFHAVLFARACGPHDRVFSFEPEPDNLALLRHNVGRNAADRVEVVGAAASDHRGTRDLHRYAAKNLGKHSFVPFDRGGDGCVAVETTTLDAWWSERQPGFERVRLLKIDVEGHEPAVIRGAATTLERTDAVFVEHSPRFLRRAGIAADAALAPLVAAGFRAHELRDGVLREADLDELCRTERHRNLFLTRPSAGAAGHRAQSGPGRGSLDSHRP